jgi:hypothetical protein
MTSDAGTLLEHVERVLDQEASRFHRLPTTRPDLGPIDVCFFEHCPTEGSLTATTFGLSLSNHSDWRLGRPELFISVDSTDPAWAMAIADIAEVNREVFAFTYGSVINLNQRISRDSGMSAFVIFAPSLSTRARLSETSGRSRCQTTKFT